MDGCDWRCSLFIGGAFLVLQWGPVIAALAGAFLLSRGARRTSTSPSSFTALGRQRLVGWARACCSQLPGLSSGSGGLCKDPRAGGDTAGIRGDHGCDVARHSARMSRDIVHATPFLEPGSPSWDPGSRL